MPLLHSHPHRTHTGHQVWALHIRVGGSVHPAGTAASSWV